MNSSSSHDMVLADFVDPLRFVAVVARRSEVLRSSPHGAASAEGGVLAIESPKPAYLDPGPGSI